MKTLTIRTPDETLLIKLKKEANKQHLSINQFVIQILKENLGLDENSFVKTYNDLDDLAGTWTENDEKLFNENISDLEKIDEELWK